MPKHNFPKEYFRIPVEGPLQLSGNFGELRPNHFHAGLDIKASAGDEVLAAADGYVVKVLVSARGYGKSLLIAHPNGYTTVYAHLDHFADSIEAYVEAEQARLHSFEVTLTPPAERFVVKAGQPVAAVGMTGTTYGAHLHYEIRDTRTGDVINPLLFGYALADQVAPEMTQLKLYELMPEGLTLRTTNYKLRRYARDVYKLYKGRDKQTNPTDTLEAASDDIAIGVKAFDEVNGSSNQFGLFGMEMYVDEKLVYAFDFEQLPFDDTRAINAHLDYIERTTNNAYFHRLYRLPGNPLAFYKTAIGDGIIHLNPAKPTKVEIVARDFAGNTAQTIMWVRRGKANLAPNFGNFSYYLPYGEERAIRQETFELDFPATALFESLVFGFKVTPERSVDMFSQVVTLHEKTVPLGDNVTLRMKPEDDLPKELYPKAVLIECSANRPTFIGNRWNGSWIEGEVREFGEYCIMLDTTAPRIVALVPALAKPRTSDTEPLPNLATETQIAVRATDRISGIDTYAATLDGAWALLEYDAKNSRFAHTFHTPPDGATHTFAVTIADRSGNSTTAVYKFVR